jgi:integrase
MTDPVKHASGGRADRQVVYAGKKEPGLFQGTRADGTPVFRVRAKIGRKAKRRTLKASTATDARRERDEWIRERKRELGLGLVGRSDLTLHELSDTWEEWARGPASPYAPRTVEYNLSALNRRALRILGAHTQAADVRPAHLRVMIDKLRAEGYSGSTIHGTLTALSAMFRFAVRRDMLETNPVRLLERGDRPSTKRLKEPRYLSRPQLDSLLANLSDEFRPIAAVLAFAALRVSEALALRWQDVDFETNTLTVHGTKTAASA